MSTLLLLNLGLIHLSATFHHWRCDAASMSDVAQGRMHFPALSEFRWGHASFWASLVAQSLGWEDPLEKEMATHSSNLPGKFHEQRNLVNYSPRGRKELGMTERHHFTMHPSIANEIWVQVTRVTFKSQHTICHIVSLLHSDYGKQFGFLGDHDKQVR